MKELSIEEKVRRYDEAIKKAKYYYDEGKTLEYAIDIVSDVFPEFNESEESEDERIKKEIIDIINSYDVAHLRAAGLPSRIPEYITWLEKQGEHANFRNKIQIGDKVTRNKDGVLVNLSQLNRVAKPSEKYNLTGIGSKHAEGKLAEMIKELKPLDTILEKQGEQKPIEWTMDNVEELTEFENAMMHIGGSFFGEHQGLDPNNTFVVKEQAKILLEMAPKQEWSEEDENIRLRLIDYLYGKSRLAKDREDGISWLKSLSPQSQWRPSEEQIDELENEHLKSVPKY